MAITTRTATLESSTTNAGIVHLNNNVYTYITNPTNPEILFIDAFPSTTEYAWFQWNFNNLGSSTYDNDYIATNIIDVTVANFRYTFSTAIPANGSPTVRLSTNLPNGVISPPSAQTVFVELTNSIIYADFLKTSGAHTLDLNSGGSSTALADIKTAIQNIENNHNSNTSDNGKWSFGTKIGTFVGGGQQFVFDRSAQFFLDITYSITTADPPVITIAIVDDETRLTLNQSFTSTKAQWEFDGPENTFTIEVDNTDGVVVNSNIEVVGSSLTTLNVVPKEFKVYFVRARQLIQNIWTDWSTSITIVSQKTKKLRPKIIYPAIIDNSFRALTSFDNWTDASNAFSTNQRFLVATKVGSLVYSGTTLDNLKIVNESTRSNYLYSVVFFGKPDLKFTITGRVSVTIDFNTNNIRLLDGNSVNIGEVNHTLKLNRNHNLQVYAYESSFIVLLNGGEMIRRVWNGGYTNHTFSLTVNTLPSDGQAVFHKISINELKNQISPTREDISDINLDFRRSMINFIDNETDKSWANWKKARNIWDKGRNIGQVDATWIDWGYPIYEPSSEEWFVPTTTIV